MNLRKHGTLLVTLLLAVVLLAACGGNDNGNNALGNNEGLGNNTVNNSDVLGNDNNLGDDVNDTDEVGDVDAVDDTETVDEVEVEDLGEDNDIDSETGEVIEEGENDADDMGTFNTDLDSGFLGASVFDAEGTEIGTAEDYYLNSTGTVDHVIVRTSNDNVVATPADRFDTDFATATADSGLTYLGTLDDLDNETSFDESYLDDDLDRYNPMDLGLDSTEDELFEFGEFSS